MVDIESIKKENEKLKEFASLVLAEIELMERISEIKEHFAYSPQSNRITEPILARILNIKEERKNLQSVLNLK